MPVGLLTFGSAESAFCDEAGPKTPESSDSKSSKDIAVDAESGPSPRLAPEDIARAQMEALTAAGKVESRVAKCYRFASPANREHTGPIEHFAEMVQSPNYLPLLNAKHFLVGHATQQDGEAYLLVTAVDPAGELTLFRFFFSKQTKAPFAGCWMTDAVIRVGTMKNPGDTEKPRNDGQPI